MSYWLMDRALKALESSHLFMLLNPAGCQKLPMNNQKRCGLDLSIFGPNIDLLPKLPKKSLGFRANIGTIEKTTRG
jgi:hypothetical protein